MTTSDQSLEPTSQDSATKLMKELEAKEVTDKEREEIAALMNASITGFNTAMNNTLEEIMEGRVHGQNKNNKNV